LSYAYANTPRTLNPEGMTPHRGWARLRVDPDGALDGDYWSDPHRRTSGRMVLRRDGSG
jgi:hypothetical protein